MSDGNGGERERERESGEKLKSKAKKNSYSKNKNSHKIGFFHFFHRIYHFMAKLEAPKQNNRAH